MILCIETATGVCSAALCDDNSVISVAEAPPGMSHAAQLTVIIQQLLEETGVKATDTRCRSREQGSRFIHRAQDRRL
ncbi:MAG: hypothetical protein MZV63_67125 [Marinilabiliales bacterium]|nr:hypothetical protein [Marinilabiliales bacterium]